MLSISGQLLLYTSGFAASPYIDCRPQPSRLRRSKIVKRFDEKPLIYPYCRDLSIRMATLKLSLHVSALIPLMRRPIDVPGELRLMIPVIQWAGGRDNNSTAGCAVIGGFFFRGYFNFFHLNCYNLFLYLLEFK